MNRNNKKSIGINFLESTSTTSQTSSGVINNVKKKKIKRPYTKAQPERTNVETISYQKLVVPKRMHSPYWKYFGFPASELGVILSQDRIICILCKKQFAYKSNTTNLRVHLQSRHKTELMVLEMSSAKDSSPKKRHGKNELMLLETSEGQIDVKSNYKGKQQDVYIQGEMNENFIGHNVTNNFEQTDTPPLSVVFQDIDNSSCDMISKVVSDAITEFVITDLHLPDVVEGKGFQRLIATLRSPCEIPGKYKLEHEIIPRIYESTRASVLNSIGNSCSTFALGIEEWRCSSLNVNITISVFFQQLDKEGLCIKQLETIVCNPNTTPNEWCGILGSLFINWNINIDQVKTVIKAFSNCNLEAALLTQGLVLIPCLIYELQKICTKFCFETEDVLNVLTKCRNVSEKLLQHNALTSVTVQDNVVQVFNSFLSREYPQIWTSTYHYLERFIQRKDDIKTLCTSLNIGFFPHELLTDKDWSIIEDIVSTLEPLKVTVTTLSEEKIPLISLLKPLINQLTSHHLKVKPGDSQLAADLKNSFANELLWKYNDINVQTFLHISTLLDPRFKDFPMTEGEEHLPTIKQELVKMVETEGSVPYDTKVNVTEVNTNVPKKSRISGIGFLLGSVANKNTPIINKNPMSLEDRLNLEIAQYESEQTPCLEECPIHWWSRMSSKCQNLIRLARKHFVYALSGSSSKLPLDLQILYYMKRSQIHRELVDKMTFINANMIDNN
ncbi:Ribonuclease H-like domain,Zinc finger C2H2-type,Zinc finger, BED-type [Cinara cedri]|uniref:Ribonuclease H-like domain,Zinc finger C2H2-type,Zinc finger, BED-type n=1 Tax=Cinara cedri TaxID=506608 RepID=A0A5E4MLV5_9HEMI|nr:Ribonuclease H-like domain,Zinc finger C2H2-type,Zinc finger, BED-type [Cinara cedri]